MSLARATVQNSAARVASQLGPSMEDLEAHMESKRPLGRKQLGADTFDWLQKESRMLAQVRTRLLVYNSDGEHH